MFLASISNDLKIYDSECWTQRFSHGKHTSPLKHIEWSDDGKYILQVNPVGRIEILSATEDGVRCLQCVPEEESSAAAFHHGGHRQVAVGCRSGRMFIWDTKFKSIVKSFSYAPSPVKMMDFNSKNKYLAAGLESGETIICNVVTNNQIGVIKVPFVNKVSALRFHSELRSVLGLASDEGCILLRDLDNGKNRLLLKDAHKSVVSDLEFSRINKDVMISCGYDKKMHVYDIRMQKIVSTIQTECALTCVDINAESLVALGNKKGELLVYDLRNFSKPLHVFADHKSSVNKVSFQPEVAKPKRFLAMDASLKESCNPKVTTPQRLKECNKTPDSVRSYDFIEQFNSPYTETNSPLKEKEPLNMSMDSFLVNIIGGSTDSDAIKNPPCISKDSPDFITKRPKDSSININNKTQKLTDTNNFPEKTLGTTSASTPIIGRIASAENASPSPISRNVVTSNDFEMNDNSNFPKYNSSTKKLESLDSVSVVETVKCDTNTMKELGNELKDFITYSIYDVLEQARNNFIQMTIQQTKNRLFLEDQISNLSQRVQDIQLTQNVLIEENKKLSIEVEMLRSCFLKAPSLMSYTNIINDCQ